MRKNLLDQLPLTPAPVDHARAVELAAISDLLDVLPEAVALVHEDLCWRGRKRVDSAKGRDGMSAEQVLRVAVLKQHTGLSYDALAFGLLDSSTYRSFCRVGFADEPPKKTTLQRNVKRVRPATWEAINELLVLKARAFGVDDGKKVRTDCTVVESNIHHPTDSTLLGDGVRVLSRLMKRARKRFQLSFTNHQLRARRRVLDISNARSQKARLPLYRDLMAVTKATIDDAQKVATQLKDVRCDTLSEMLLADAIAAEIKHFVPLIAQVMSQTRRRVFEGESVPANEKIVSIFETHTDIIIKGARDIEYGHKVCLTTGKSSLVTDVVVEKGNPSDSALATRTIERHKKLFGAPPRQASFDGGFASKSNLLAIKKLGVKDVVFHKRCGIAVEDMTSSKRKYKKLRAFRAGIEGSISFLKRIFGLERCFWRGWDSFRAYVHASVLSCNLLIVARHIVAARG